MASKLKEGEIKVFLKCQDCGTFITSPSFPVIKKHFDKCQQTANSCLTSTQIKNDDGEDMECDFIDDKIETVTFSQPFVVLQKLDRNIATFNKANDCNISIKSTNSPNKRKRQNKIRLMTNNNKSPQVSSPVLCSIFEHLEPPSEPTPRKSRLKAAQKLSNLIKMEERAKHFNLDEDDDEWLLEAEPASDVEFILDNKTEKTPKRKYKKRKERTAEISCVYDNPACPFKCTVCPARFKTEFYLNRHKQRVHEIKTDDVFSCSICNRMINFRLCFQAHLKRHENAEDTEQAFNLWTKWPELPKTMKKQAVFNCKYCLMPHTNHRDFISHMATEHSDKARHSVFPCPYSCPSQLTSIKRLIEHFKEDHKMDYYGKTLKWDEGTSRGREYPQRQCDECGKMFEMYYLAAHKRRYHSANSVPKVTPENPYQCPYPQCLVSCKSVLLLKSHFILHLQNNPYLCTFPGCHSKADNSSHLKKHMKLHLDPVPRCGKCGVSYASRCKFRNHDCDANLEKQRSGEFKLIQVATLWKLKPSSRVSGDAVVTHVDDIKPFSEVKGDSGSDEALNKYIESTQRIDINMVIRTDPVFIIACEDSPGFGQLILGHRYFNEKKISPKKVRANVYKCSKCPTVFGGLYGYNEHKKTCDGSGQVSKEDTSEDKQVLIGCPICGNAFLSSDLLELHLTECHAGDEVFKCEEPDCGRYFANESSKKTHSNHYHTEFPYHCQQCGHGFKTQDGFQRHMNLHSLDQDFMQKKLSAPCAVCGKTLSNATSLRRHMQMMHGITVKTPVKTKALKPKKKITTKSRNKGKLVKQVRNALTGVRRSGRQQVGKMFFDKCESNEGKQGDEDCVKIKIEPELIVGPDMESDFGGFEHVGKFETE